MDLRHSADFSLKQHCTSLWQKMVNARRTGGVIVLVFMCRCECNLINCNHFMYENVKCCQHWSDPWNLYFDFLFSTFDGNYASRRPLVETRLWWQIINPVNFSLINLHKQAAHGNGSKYLLNSYINIAGTGRGYWSKTSFMIHSDPIIRISEHQQENHGNIIWDDNGRKSSRDSLVQDTRITMQSSWL